MTRPDIIGLTGPAGCGKDTVAMLLQVHLRFNHSAFADALRSEVCHAFNVPLRDLTYRVVKEIPSAALALARCKDNGFTGAMLHSQAFKDSNLSFQDFLEAARSPRQIMQWWGTEYRRESDNSYWTRGLVQKINLQQKAGQHRHVVSDVRFDNEAAAIRAMGGQIWQIKRPGVQSSHEHVSAVDGGQFKPDAVINNSLDLTHLKSLVLGAWLMAEASMCTSDLVQLGLAHHWAVHPANTADRQAA